MALPTLDAVFASAADVPRRYMLSQWLVNELGSGSVADYITLPERYLWAKIAIAAGAPLDEASYISLPKQYVWKAIYDSVSGSSLGTIDWSEKQALGHIAAAYRGDTGNPANLATYIDWPWRYQVASIIIYTSTDSDVLAFIAASGATDIEGLDAFVKGVKNLGLWESMVAWPLRSSQNAGTGTTAYSLGGLGTNNGTLVNTPTWGIDGVIFNGSNQRITSNDTIPISGDASRTLMTVSNSNTGNLNAIAALSSATSLEKSWGILHFPNNTTLTGWDGVAANNSTIGNVTANLFSSASYGWDGSRFGTINGIQTLSGGGASAPNTDTNCNLNIGATNVSSGSFAWNYDGKISFVALFVTGGNTNIYTLYKQTLGAGLGLP